MFASPALAVQNPLEVDGCGHQLAVERNDELADFFAAPTEMRALLTTHFKSLGLSLDALYLSPDRKRWLAIAHYPGKVSLPDGAWSSIKAQLANASEEDRAPETRSLDIRLFEDQGDRYALVSKGSGEGSQGFLEASIGEAWDVSTGCLLRITLRSDDPDDAVQIFNLLKSLTLLRRE